MMRPCLACLAVFAFAHANVEETSQFHVKPNGLEQTAEISLSHPVAGKVSCIFTYACQGGTGENWDAKLSLSQQGSDEDDQVSCEIAREGGSYLYFSKFKVEVSGGVAFTEISGNSGPLAESQYDTGNSDVISNDKFENMLAKIFVGFYIPRTGAGGQEL